MKRTKNMLQPHGIICGIFVIALAGAGCQSAQKDEANNVVEPAVTQTEAAVEPDMAQEETLPETQQTATQQSTQEASDSSDSSRMAHDVGFEDNVWMEGEVGMLLRGVDGAPYPPYRPAVIEQTQEKLKELGMYDGPTSGVLDETTMQAVAEFQKNNGVHPSGVPSPETRKELGIGEDSTPENI
jgi:hypothetical protein